MIEISGLAVEYKHVTLRLVPKCLWEQIVRGRIREMEK